MNEKPTRNSVIDILKGIGITLMVAGHSGFPYMNFVSLFHMPIFFMASGYFYKEKYSNSKESVTSFIRKKLKQLYIPYIIWNSIFILLNNVFIKLNIYTNNKDIALYHNTGITKYKTFNQMLKKIIRCFYFDEGTAMGAALWFLEILLFISIFYCVFDYVLKKCNVNKTIGQNVISFFLLMLGYFLSLKDISIFGLSKVASYYCLYHLGYMLNNIIYIKDERNKNILVIVCFVVLLYVSKKYSFSINKNDYVNPLYLLICSLAGWILIYWLSSKIEKYKIGNFLEFIGKNTLDIMALHLVSMKIIAYGIVVIKHLPFFCVAAFPNLYGESGWWALYTFAGSIFPLLFSCLKKLLKREVTE